MIIAAAEAMNPVPDHILLRPNGAGNRLQGVMLAFRKTNNLIYPRSTALFEAQSQPERERCRSVEQKRTSLASKPNVGFGSKAEELGLGRSTVYREVRRADKDMVHP
jgi:hypothetical protein